MKSIYKIAPFITLLFLFASCDLDRLPDNRTDLDTAQKIRKLLVSAYPEGSYWYLTEMMSDNTDEHAGAWTSANIFQEQAYHWKEITDAQNDNTYYIWEKHYAAIAAANAALEALDNLPAVAEMGEDIEAIRAEALLCRAYGHFALVNLFSLHYNPTSSQTDLGIPYATEVEKSLVVKHERGTVAKTYEMIEKDIEAALPIMSDGIHDQPTYHFNARAAYAFAARFNLYYRKYDKVIEYATKVLGNNPSLQLRDWKSLGLINAANENLRPDAYISIDSRANLLLVPATSAWGYVHGPYRTGARFTHSDPLAKGEGITLEVTGKHSDGTNKVLPWGNSFNFFVRASSYPSSKKCVVRKFATYFEFTDPVNQIGYPHLVQPLFTTDELLLCRAEAYILQNRIEEANEDLKIFYAAFSYEKNITVDKVLQYFVKEDYYRPQVPTAKKPLNIDFALTETQEAFIHYLLYTRRLETVHEGLRWFDIKRYGIEIYRRTLHGDDPHNAVVTDKLEVNDPRRAIQLPYEVVTAGLEANPR